MPPSRAGLERFPSGYERLGEHTIIVKSDLMSRVDLKLSPYHTMQITTYELAFSENKNIQQERKMPIFVKFVVPKIKLNCIYDNEVDLEHWDAVKKAISSNNVVLNFIHRPTLYGFEVKYSSIYDGSVNLEIIADGVVSLSASGSAKIEGSAKAVKEVNSSVASDFIFDGITTDIPDAFGGMNVSDEAEKAKASVVISDKKI